jgi:MFS family permease
MFTDLSELWKIPSFRKLLLARFISNYGNGLAPIALAFGVLELKGSSASDLSTVMAAQMFPMVVFMLFGGVIADRYPRALIVGVSDVVVSAFVIFNGISFIDGKATILSLSMVAFVGGTLTALWWPAFGGLVPEVVPEEMLQSANSAIGIGSNMSNIAGTVTGGIVVASFGAGWGLIVDGITFLIAGILVFQLRGLGSTRTQDEHSPTVLEDLVHGWREFISRSWVVAVVAGYSVIAMLMESVFAVVGPVHAKNILGGPKPWSWIMGSLAAGMMCGVIVSLRVRPKRPLVAGLVAQIGFGVWLLAMGLSTSLILICLAAFLAGVAMDFFMVLWQTALQRHIPRESLSRVTSYDAFGSLALAPLGLVVAGPIAARFGSAHTLLLFSAMFFVSLAAMLLVPSVWRLKSQPVDVSGAA